MTITIKIDTNPSKPYAGNSVPPQNPQQLLDALGTEFACADEGVLQDSVPESDLDYLTPHRNGFLRTILDAYAGHHHVVLRPDDIWIAFLSQFNFYMQSHPDVAKTYFLPQLTEGERKPLPFNFIGSSSSVNFAIVVNQMTRELQAQIADESFREFVLPGFSTTTIEDKITAALLMIATVQPLFEPSMSFMCGIPSLCLLGTEEDWTAILNRIQPLAEGKYGNEARHWGQTLIIVLTKFVAAFQKGSNTTPGADDRPFWESIVRFSKEDNLIGGWITAFARWGPSYSGSYEPPFELPPDEIKTSPHFTSGGLKFPVISPSKIPSAIGTIDIQLVEDGRNVTARLIAGHLGKTWLGVKSDTFQPCSAWLLYIPKPIPTASPQADVESARDKMRRVATSIMKSKKEKEEQGGSRWRKLVPGHSRRASEKLAVQDLAGPRT